MRGPGRLRCKRHGGDPREVYAKHLDEFIELLRQPLSDRPARPAKLAKDPGN